MRSPLLRLPAEIRNRIYGLVFTGATVHLYSPHIDYETKPIEWTTTLSPLTTCRQVHYEAKAIAYQYCKFDITDQDLPSVLGDHKDHGLIQHIVVSGMAARCYVDEFEHLGNFRGILIFPDLLRLEVRQSDNPPGTPDYWVHDPLPDSSALGRRSKGLFRTAGLVGFYVRA